uniref:C2 domain-containing protein n=2 Tax=Lactuca sativa TaxID=4236 RepID=A0A9R1UHJ9_LACSA|nr:hypothetical protein LSAT_V11C900498180 [Lactuca sativa]
MDSHQNLVLSNPSFVGQQEFNSNGIMEKKDGFIGVLDVFIHEARDIHNICIYHKQDVYAKIFLTSDPESTESTQTINGGGQNPVFNENLQINVRTVDCSLRCEIWMLSRVKNYLEDQLLGFALVPLREIIVKNQNFEKEFELSTSELLHSPSGFVKLSINYIGSSPFDMLEIHYVPHSLCNQDSDESDEVSCELEKIEFPDPKLMNENEIMVSEYYSHATENDDSISNSYSNDHLLSRIPQENLEIVSRNSSKSPEKKDDNTETETEHQVMQQEIVNMYLKSMKQFTEALAKMKLPIEKGNESTHNTDSNPKVFYGSRAFF